MTADGGAIELLVGRFDCLACAPADVTVRLAGAPFSGEVMIEVTRVPNLSTAQGVLATAHAFTPESPVGAVQTVAAGGVEVALPALGPADVALVRVAPAQ